MALLLYNISDFCEIEFCQKGVFVMNMGLNQSDESARLKLLEEEFKLRKKQPEPWTKTKYRKYANFGLNRKKKEEVEKK